MLDDDQSKEAFEFGEEFGEDVGDFLDDLLDAAAIAWSWTAWFVVPCAAGIAGLQGSIYVWSFLHYAFPR